MTFIDFLQPYRAFKRLDGEVGIEIETETKVPYDVPNFFFWTHHGDNSLRDFGIEYVLKQPVMYKDVKKALEEFEEKTQKIKFIADSFSTSTHIHLNILNEEVKTIGNFVVLYTLYENLLIRYSGPTRLSNLFCLPICDAEDTYKHARSIFQYAEQRMFKGMILGENAVKYAALNLSAIGKYGSIEIRSLRGETKINQIQEWVDILYSIMKYSRGKINPKEIMEKYRTNPAKLKEEVFGEFSKVISCEDENKLVENNVFFAASIAYGVKDWEKIGILDIPKFKPSAQALDGESIRNFNKSFENLTAGEQDLIFKILLQQHNQAYMTGTLKKKSRSKNDVEIALNEMINHIGQAAGVPNGINGDF